MSQFKSVRIGEVRRALVACAAQIPIGSRSGGVIALTSRRRGALAGMMAAGGAQVLRLLVLAIAAIFRPKAPLIAENLCLRQQLVVPERRHLRPRLSGADRRFWVLASRWLSDWHHPLLIVKPETVLGWQRAGWTAYWRVAILPQSKKWPPAIPVELLRLQSIAG
jgi:hypothetical protein